MRTITLEVTTEELEDLIYGLHEADLHCGITESGRVLHRRLCELLDAVDVDEPIQSEATS